MSLHSTHFRSQYVITVDESELRPEKCGQRMQILKKNHPPNKTLRPEHVVKCSRFKGGLYSEKSRWDPIWIYHGVLSTHQDIYCSASNTDCSRRGPSSTLGLLFHGHTLHFTAKALQPQQFHSPPLDTKESFLLL